MDRQSLAIIVIIVAAVSVTGSAGSSKVLNITNSCTHTVWPEISSKASSATPNNTTGFGFELAPGQLEVVPVPSEWSGRVWGRTLCTLSTDDSSGNDDFKCVTGGPVTLAEFTLGGSGDGMDLYDVSVVDGFNLPVTVAPQLQGGNGNYCAPTGCSMVDMNGVGACPPELRVTGGVAVVGCKSACQAFGSPQYCCTGEYGNSNTCKPSAYSELFKKACPRAVSYAHDYGDDSIFTCGGGCGGGDSITYAITFCPSTTSSGKLSSNHTASHPPSGTGTNLPHIDCTTPTPHTGGNQSQVVGGATPPWRIVLAVAVLGLVAAVLGLLAAALGALAQFWGLSHNQAAAAAAAAAP